MYQFTFHCKTSVYFLQADPYSKWAILNVKDEDLPVSEVFPHFLADSHHQVSILAAKSITRWWCRFFFLVVCNSEFHLTGSYFCFCIATVFSSLGPLILREIEAYQVNSLRCSNVVSVACVCVYIFVHINKNVYIIVNFTLDLLCKTQIWNSLEIDYIL